MYQVGGHSNNKYALKDTRIGITTKIMKIWIPTVKLVFYFKYIERIDTFLQNPDSSTELTFLCSTFREFKQKMLKNNLFSSTRPVSLSILKCTQCFFTNNFTTPKNVFRNRKTKNTRHRKRLNYTRIE